MYFHWQNLIEDARGKPRGFPWHGRAWFRFVKDRDQAYRDEPAMHVEWVIGSKRFGAKFRMNPHEEEQVGGSIAIPPLALYWGFEVPHKSIAHRIIDWIAGGPTDVNRKYGNRVVDFSIHDWSLWWHVWVDDDGWTKKRPRWRHGSFNITDFVLGKNNYESVVVKECEIIVPMPERSYRGRVKLTEDSWTRPRWFPLRVRRAHVDMVEPIPFPGKGENSWDCGQDAMHGITANAKSVPEIVGVIVADVLRSRERYGGKNWRPEEPQAVA